MGGITLFTSGSTDEPKKVNHSWERLKSYAMRSLKESKLGPEDRVLDVFPSNTIAHYTITAYPALLSGAHLCTATFNAYSYIELFKEIQPTFISLIPRHYELLKKTKGFAQLDMSCVRYMVTGSNKIDQEFIDTFRNQGVPLIANWYGMTEYPPPILVGYNSTKFDMATLAKDEHIMFHPVSATSQLAECIINGRSTGDIFDLSTMEFYARRKEANRTTWKNEF